MDPFAMARRDLAASALGVDAVYQYKGSSTPFPVRLIFSQAENSGMRGFDTPGKGAVRTEAVITDASLNPFSGYGPKARPQPGDLIGLGTEKGWKVATVEADARGISYTLTLARQD
ncbi:hypothetical protein BKE38_05095 [Pseudoroseomonas deserti]|uniref:Uncharacterized protein n=1 Tax=Teichococcus deserti TaxID=1817963 RepID=A0A1V2H8C2_9PROT|nr:hypothetical protein [Pseudoroseomonas deserti]ONG56972.1 hypothetical protein BKE38_05095 [Pseudoroseomonas deserti]